MDNSDSNLLEDICLGLAYDFKIEIETINILGIQQPGALK